MKFSEDNQLLLTLTGAPDYLLICWNWAKAKLVASLDLSHSGNPMTQCTFSPIDASIACVTGNEAVKFFRIAERDMRSLRDNEVPDNIITHCWLRSPEDYVVTGTDNAEIIVFKSSEFVFRQNVLKRGMAVQSIITYEHGIIIGSDNGTFEFYVVNAEKAGAGEPAGPRPGFFTLEKTVQTSLTSKRINSMCLNPDEDMLVAVSSDNQMMSFPMVSIPNLKSEDITMLQVSFHASKAITGLDVCVRKPLFATCSKDNTLRVWNYQLNELELCKHFPEDMFCVALHPSGLHLAVGFTDKLRIYHVLVDELRPCLELSIKSCRECHFSNGGNKLAVVNGNTISVFDFHTGEKVVDLRGHNGKVRNIYWLPNGFQLISCGQDGAIYLWNLDNKRLGDYVNKGVMYTAVVVGPQGVVAVGSDRRLLELDVPDLLMTQDRSAEALLTHLAMSSSKGLLFAGTSDPNKPGGVRSRANDFIATVDVDITTNQIIT